jgi:hypothetical protein
MPGLAIVPTIFQIREEFPMRSSLCLILFLFAAPGFAEEKKEGKIDVDAPFLEKEGIKIKSCKIELQASQLKGVLSQTILCLFEQTKDIEPEKAKELAGLFTVAAGNDSPMQVYFFDEDNVAIATVGLHRTEGVVTGKKGEAFRVWVQVPVDKLKKTRKIEFRKALPKKPIKKGK